MRRIAPLLLLLAPALAACSGSADDDAAVPDAVTGSAGAPAGASDGSPDLAASAPAPPSTTVPPPPSAPPPETGVPGLDSTDAFCAAWSRYAGSFQVVAVASFFGESPMRAYELDVSAAHVVRDAYAALDEHWPGELQSEQEAALHNWMGPFAGRSSRIAEALESAGATPDVVAHIESAWLDALAARDPENPDLDVQLDEPAATLVREVAADLATQLPPLSEDPALVTSEVLTPLTDAYLAEHCPDQGLLAGSDVEG